MKLYIIQSFDSYEAHGGVGDIILTTTNEKKAYQVYGLLGIASANENYKHAEEIIERCESVNELNVINNKEFSIRNLSLKEIEIT